MLQGSSLLLVALHCASTDELGFVPLYAEKLEHVVARLIDDLERDFIGGRRGRKSQHEPAEEEPGARLSELCATLEAAVKTVAVKTVAVKEVTKRVCPSGSGPFLPGST
ncbi:MAG: hypothetical protein M3N31_09000 [Actinomycetota bacterium]|nr:hypothetical protein [Actinomycetota bacterium]